MCTPRISLSLSLSLRVLLVFTGTCFLPRLICFKTRREQMIRERCSRWEVITVSHASHCGRRRCLFWSLPIRANKTQLSACFCEQVKEPKNNNESTQRGGREWQRQRGFFVWPMWGLLVTEIDQSERGCEVISMRVTAPQWADWGGIKERLREYREQRERVRNETLRERER